MEPLNLYDEIFRRKSVRKYAPQPLSRETLDLVHEFLGKLAVINGENPVETDIVSRDSIGSVYGVTAPHYALFYAGDEQAGKIEAGFRVQLLSLYLSSIGVGSCIVGMARPKKPLRSKGGLSWVISLAMGAAEEPLHRRLADFKRKPISEISADVPLKWVEAVRLAPSAINNQPWFLTGDETSVHLYKRSGGVKSVFAASYFPVDMGIALCHLTLAAVRDGKSVSFSGSVPAPIGGPKGGAFIGTAIME